ncbi:MAG: nitroreductase family protein [Candidatus Accumulibacter sp.]|jgi:nitroreductase|nr:nitroreductase family protein [Accumulibacter sp.]
MAYSNPTIDRILEHRTIREFTEEKVPEEMLAAFLEVINRTASSTGMQAFSVIRATDPKVRRDIAQVCGQEYVARAPELFIFIVDAHRNARIAQEQGSEAKARRGMDRFFQGCMDAVLAAQNLTTAVESAGLGAVFLGSILNDAEAIVRILKLPELTFPVLGVGFGRPNQDPMKKPRMPIALKLFENEYQDRDAWLPAIAEYDKEMETYYDLRERGKRSDSFSGQVARYLDNLQAKRAKMLRVARAQGFDLGLDD